MAFRTPKWPSSLDRARAAARSDCEQLEARRLLATFTVVSAAGAGPGTLRQAIIDANATPAADEIEFNIPAGGGVATISVIGELPQITQPLSILGGTQPGSMPNTAEHGTNAVITVAIVGSGVGVGLELNADNCLVSRLSIGRFSSAVTLLGQSARVEGNFIGVAPDGITPVHNTDGVSDLGSQSSIIGGSAPAKRNLISANKITGLFLKPVADLKVQGNLIGTDRSGELQLPNEFHGVFVESQTVITDNVISGNEENGVVVNGQRVTLYGNRIGVGSRGIASVPNLFHGIFVRRGENIRIGDVAQRPNVIAHNGMDGIHISQTADRVVILNNVTRDNGDLGINLDGGTEDIFGTSANDPEDADGGANRLQNWPILGSAVTTAGRTAIVGTLNSTPNTAFTIEFYGNFTTDPSGHGEGAVRLGEVIATTDGNGNATFSLAAAATLADFVSATATDNTSLETSEFSTNVANQRPFSIIPVTSNAPSGKNTLAEAIFIAETTPGLQGIRFDLPAGSETITLGGAAGGSLPLIFDPLIIDGSTQRGFAGVPLVHLTQSASLTNGIFLRAGQSAVTWLTISRFVIDAIALVEFPNNTIAYNNLGTAAAGNNHGLALSDSDNNLIIGNTFVNSAGGVNPGALTMISSSDNTIIANRFGVTIDGVPLINAGDAIRVSTFFGDPPGNNIVTGNIITRSSTGGVVVPSVNGGSTGNRIFGNSIYDNGGLGIDLHNTGVNPNDNGDGDIGANDRQNFPLLTSATAAAMGGINLAGTLNSTANATFRVEVYANDVADPTNHGEGRYVLGSFVLTTNSSGNATFNQHLAAGALHGQKITATATDAMGNTSEFGPNVTFADAAAPVVLAQFLRVRFGVEYTFRTTENVTADLNAAQLLGVSRNNRGADFAPMAVSFDPVTNEATYRFPTDVPDGNYRVVLNRALITDAAGNQLVSTAPLATFVFSGDANRDRAINIGDFSVMAANFNRPGDFSTGDFNFSGTVEIGDFAILAGKFNQTLPAPRASVALPRQFSFSSETVGDSRPLSMDGSRSVIEKTFFDALTLALINVVS
jgi:hypothetical protein